MNTKSNIDIQVREKPNAYKILFEALNQQNIKWCSWKSNEHLIEGLDGTTDVDLLFQENDRQIVTKILHDCGFIFFQAPAYKSYPAIIDAVSVDTTNGRMLHAHSHFLLTAGEKHLKGVILPWNDIILETRIPSELSSDIYVSDPNVELILLLVRESLKIRKRDKVKGKNPSVLWGGKGFNKELEWLKQRADIQQVRDYSIKVLNAPIADLLCEMTEKNVTFERVVKLQSLVNQHAEKHYWRRMGSISGVSRIWFNEAMYILTRIFEKTGLLKELFVRRRTLSDKGLIVAFLGPDGSGKSTVTKTIVTQWEHKIDVTRVYFGTGDGSKTVLFRLLGVCSLFYAKLKEFRKKRKQPSKEKNNHTSKKSDKIASLSIGALLYAIAGILSKKKQIRRVQKLKNRGFIVICDRWPQNQIFGMNDGPLLSEYVDHPQFIYRSIAKWEKKQFAQICQRQQPDIVIRLMPSLDVAVGRKEENKKIAEVIHKKLESLEKLEFSADIEIHTINADNPLDDVLALSRGIIWNNLQSKFMFKPRLYECLGLSGAGKTTICREIINGLQIKTVEDVFPPADPISTVNKAILTVQSMLFDPILYALIIRAAFDFKLWRHKESISYLFKLPVQKLRLKKATKADVHLIEQLLLQNIWSAFVSGKVQTIRPEHLAPMITRLYQGLNEVVLYFDINVAEASKRVSQRHDGTSRFDDLPESEILECLNKTQNVMRDLVKSASYAGLNIVYIDASLPIEMNINETIAQLIKGNS